MLLFLVLLAACPRGEGDAKRSQTRLDLAKDFLAKHELEAAESEANKAIAYMKSNDEAWNIRGLVHLLRAYDAQRILEVDSCLTGIDADAIRTDLDSELQKAASDFAQAVSISADYGEAWSNRGSVANLSNDYAVAAGYLEKALENPARLENPGLTRSHLGWSMFHQGNLIGAAKELRQAVQFQPGMCVASYRLGRVYFAREEWEKAAEHFQEVSGQKNCGSQEASYYLMLTRQKQGLADEAAAAQAACLSLSPKSCVAIRCRAEAGAGRESGR